MALFFHSKYKSWKLILEGSKVRHQPGGGKKVVRHPKFIKFRGGRYETEDKGIIEILRNHADYNLFLFEIDKEAEHERMQLLRAGTPFKYICPFCDKDCVKKAELAVHINDCPKNPVNIQEDEAMKTALSESQKMASEEEGHDPSEFILTEDEDEDDEDEEEEVEDAVSSMSRPQLLRYLKDNDIKVDGNPTRLSKDALIKVVRSAKVSSAGEGVDEQDGDSSPGSE